MKIAVIGSGYVGLTSSVCFAKKGHKVLCVDIDAEKIKMINAGNPPIYEAGMKSLLKHVLNKGLLKATLDADNAIKESSIVFICVGTPSREDGSIDLKYIKSAAETISQSLNDYKTIVVKSTVMPGTTMNIVKPVLEKSGKSFGICMNPEFLKEGTAIKDLLEGDRIVLGVDSSKTESIMRKLYKDFPQKVFVTTPATAEMIKYANNCVLAAKISFANELGNLCKRLGIDSYKVMDGAGLDSRICRSFLDSGAGFGGSCFPKDVKAILSKGLSEGEPMKLLKTVLEINEEQPVKMIELLKKHVNPKDRTIGVLGLAFKPGTDDVREAPSLKIINELLRLNAKVIAYDPKAMNNVKKIYKNRIVFAENCEELINKSDAVLIVTDWPEFKKPGLYKNKIVIAGRRVKAEQAKIYEGICW